MDSEELKLFSQFFEELAQPTDDPMHYYVSYNVWEESLGDMRYLKTKGFKFSQSMTDKK